MNVRPAAAADLETLARLWWQGWKSAPPAPAADRGIALAFGGGHHALNPDAFGPCSNSSGHVLQVAI
jgi:hypothetical protein